MQESQEHYFEEDSIYQAISRYEDMVRANTTSYFDVYEFEVIVDYYLDQNHFSMAEDALGIALSQHPEAVELKFRLSQLLINSGKPAKGIRILRDIEHLEANNPEFFIVKGTALNLLGKKQEADQAFKEAINLSSDSRDEVLHNISLSYIHNRHYKQAIRYLLLAHEINPANLDVLQELALVYERIDELSKCVIYYEKYIDIDPFNDTIWLNLGLIYSSIDKNEKALEAFDYALCISPSNLAALLSRANLCINTGDYSEAIQSYLEILELDPVNVQALTYIGECYEKQEFYKRSVYYFKKAISLDEQFSDAWYGLGVATYQQDLIVESVPYFKRALQIDPENSDYWFMMGEVYRKLQELEKSAEAFNRAVELDPNDYEAWICRAELSCKNNNDLKGAISILNKAILYNRDNSTINYQLATYYFQNNQSKLGFSFFEKGLEINFTEHTDFLDNIAGKYASKLASELIIKYKN